MRSSKAAIFKDAIASLIRTTQLTGGLMEQAETISYSIIEQTEILNLARYVLTSVFAGKSISELESETVRLVLPPAERVNITLRSGGKLRGSMSSATLSNLGRQIVQAVYRTAMDRRFGGPLTRWELPYASFEVWIQIGSEEITPDARYDKNCLLLGIEGLEIEGQGQSAYYKPSVAITSKNKSVTALLEALSKKAGLDKDDWKNPDVCVQKTRWICLDSASTIGAGGSNGQTEESIPLDTWIAESVAYLVRNQDVSGATAYLYDPIGDIIVPSAVSVVRAAGCLFALSQVLRSHHCIAKDETFRMSVIQMARSLLNRTQITGDRRRIVQEETRWQLPKVGATALLTAALSADMLRAQFNEEYQQLYHAVTSAQNTDGRFCTRFGLLEENEQESKFCSGQALLVLAMEAKRGNAVALQQCLLAFEPYVLQFRAAPATAFVGWHVDVWSRIFELTGDPVYAAFVFEQSDWLLQMQIRNHYDSRWLGGFSKTGTSPPSFSSIVFLEAIVRALQVAIRIGDAVRIQRYSSSVRVGFEFCRRLRLEETSPPTLLGDRARCRGGIALDLVDRTVRCDVVQHFITLCLATEQVHDYVL
jgi:AMMECR1 domain-containing protein